MGREVKRVPVDFDWKQGEVWEGYVFPDRLNELPCPAGEACRNGQTAAAAWVMSMTAMLLMLDGDLRAQQLGRPMHPYFNDVSSYGYGCRPSEDIAEFGTGLAGREAGFMGHDAIDNWAAYRKIVEAAGLDSGVWGMCPACRGHATVEAFEGQRAEGEKWERTDPPKGDGWQLWETVSEGSPVSPVFDTAEGLARHIGGDFYKTLAWVTGPGWAPSGMFANGRVLTATDISRGEK